MFCIQIVVSGVAETRTDVETYARCTLLAASMEDPPEGADHIQECIDFLLDAEFIALLPSSEVFRATPLGSAVLASALSPDEGLMVFSELQKARRCFVLENDLHLVYVVSFSIFLPGPIAPYNM